MGVVVPMLRLDAAMQRRSAAFTPRKGRTVVTPGGVAFTKSKQGLAISYTWGGGSYRNTVDIIRVGVGRFGLIRCGKCAEIVTSREMLSALRDYRRSAAVALDDRRDAERARQ